MKKISFTLFGFLLFVFTAKAIVITITYDATQGVTALSGSSEVYMHSGANNEVGALNGSCWKYVMGNWGQADGIGKMTSSGSNLWSITIDPVAYYSQAANGPVSGNSIKRIGMVFRNEMGTLEGKDVNNADIFVDLSGTTPAAYNSNGSLFAGVTVSIKPNMFSSSITATRYLAVGHINDTLKVIDSTNYGVVHKVRMISDSIILGSTGLARHPKTGLYYSVLRLQDLYNRYLGTVNPATGAVTLLGNIGDRMSNIIFLPSGKLLGVTGNGALNPESLFEINTSNGAATFIRTLGAGSGGEAIGYCPDDGQIYHRSGIGTQAYEKIDTLLYNITLLPMINNPNTETFCMLYIGNGNFISIDLNNDVVTIDTAGLFTVKTNLSQPYKGLEYLSCTRNITGPLNLCAGSSIELTATPGAMSYQWYRNGIALAGQQSTSLSVSSGGKYNCIFTDLCGSDSLPVSISVQLQALPIVAINGLAGFCEGGNVVLTGSGGGSSQWYKNGISIPGATTSTYTASTVGLYNMIKTNTNGCADSAAVGKTIVEYPIPLLAIVQARNLKCFGDNSGSLSSSVSSGTSPYIYSWSNGASTAAINGLAAGSYVAIVTDSKMCQDTVSVTITEPAALQLGILTTPVLCNGDSTGTAIANASGGSGTIAYSWSNGSTGFAATNLNAATYTVTLTDDSLCTKTDQVQILEPQLLQVTGSATDVLCFGGNNGSAAATVSGGTFPYSYSWTSGGTQASEPNLIAGTYSVFIADSNQCVTQTSVVVNEPIALSIDTIITSANSGLNNGAIDISVSGGTAPFTFLWNNGDTSQNISNLAPGVYFVTITDANACVFTSGNIALIGVGLKNTSAENFIRVSPNPSNGNFQVITAAKLHFNIFNSQGALVAQFDTEKQKPMMITQKLPSGIYQLRAADGNNLFNYKLVITD